MARIIDGYLGNDLVVYRGMQTGGAIGKGFDISVPDIENASVEWLNGLEDTLRALLLSLGGESRMQLRWTVDSDYRDELLRYYRETETRHRNEWELRNRHERFTRYWKRMTDKTLRRERLRLYVSSRFDASKAPKFKRSGTKLYEYLLGSASTEMKHFEGILSQLLGSVGGKVAPMDDLRHLQDFYTFFNPSAVDIPDLDYRSLLDEIGKRSICDLCFNSEGSPVPGHGFYMDGHYHGILVIKSLPKQTYIGMIRRLTSLPMLDYSITANIEAIPAEIEINATERELEKLTYAASKPKIAAMIDKLNVRVRRLMSNQTTPFKVQYVIRAWDKTPDGLSAKLSTIKAAVSKMGGAQLYEPSLPTSARNFWNVTFPGWTFDRYQDLKLYIEDNNLADLLPVSSTPVADLNEAEAIYDGANGNLIGIQTFVGREGAKRPEHGIMFGSSGGGKSVLTIDLLSQIAPYYDFFGIVEEGLSYNYFTRLMGCEPVIIQPQGNLTFNYLDPKGMPLGSMAKGGAVAMLHLLVGQTGDIDKDKRRRSILSNHIERLFADKFSSWQNANPHLAERVARHSLAIEHWLREKLPPGSTEMDAFLELRALRTEDETRYEELLASIDPSLAEKRKLGGEGAEKLMAIGYSYMGPAEVPTHGEFQEMMLLESLQRGASQDLALIASGLEPWNRSGEYGQLLDGPNNIEIGGTRVAHFELGYIPEQAGELKTVASFLITNEMRNAIMRMPRDKRKAVVLEELSAFLAIPEGERITREFYERMRKYSAWVFSIIQQYDRIREHPVRSGVMGNSRLMFMLKQPDKRDLDHICESFPLPEITRQEVARFPDPSEMKVNPYGGFAFCHQSESRPTIALGRHYSTKEMLMAASTSGEAFERNMQLLKQYNGDVFKLVTTEGQN